MAVTTSAIAYALKRVYTPRTVANLVYKDNPALALISKATGFTGSHAVHSIRYRDTMGRSQDFTQAQSVAQGTNGTTAGLQFLVTRVKNYQIYTLDTEAILAGKDDKGAMLQTLRTEVDSAFNNLGRDLAIDLFRSGSGVRARNTNVTSTTVTVGEDIVNFEVGMTVICQADLTSAARNSATGATIATIDRDAGTFTLTANTDSMATNDYIWVKGDRPAGAMTPATYVKMAGFDAWVPSAAPSVSESFFGVDRSPDATRNAGLRIDISSYNPEEGLVTALHKLAREGGRPSHLFLDFVDSRNIQLALGAKAEVEYMQVGDIGFSSIRVRGPKGDVRVIPDQNAQTAVGNLLTLDTWQLHHLGEMINVLDLDGARLSREASADRFEGRMAFYGNLRCFAPGENARLVMPS